MTINAQNLAQSAYYAGSDQVIMGNGQGLAINSIDSSLITSPFSPNVKLSLNNLLHVPAITMNLISVSKFAKDNNVFFEFHPNTRFWNHWDLKLSYYKVILEKMDSIVSVNCV